MHSTSMHSLSSLALLCIRLQCILVLCITAQCIALQGIQAGVRKDPKNRVDVRTCLHTDFIDFLGFKSIFVFWLCLCFDRFI